MSHRKIEDRIDVLLEYLTDYIYTVEINDGKVVSTYHGPGCVTVTGYSSEDYAKDPELWLRMVHVDDKDLVAEQAANALAGENVKPIEHRIIHKDGFTRWVKNSIVLSKDEQGKVLFYDGLINDITDLKRAEKNNDVKRKQLIQADKMASLGVLVSGIAHEINNPNNFILLNAKFLEKVWKELYPVWKNFSERNSDFIVAGMSTEQLEDHLHNSFKGISEGVNRINKITRSLTDYARQDHGKLNEEVDLTEIVKNAVLITGNLIKKSTNNFAVNYNTDFPKVFGNKQQLEQVVINLINNSCQSLNSKDSKIEINFQTLDTFAVIEVIDEGVGMDEITQKKIFDPFFTTKRNSGGTGLGLSISFNIIKHHNGEMSILSTPGEGTICQVKIPIAENKI